jgi:hypothetical protein
MKGQRQLRLSSMCTISVRLKAYYCLFLASVAGSFPASGVPGETGPPLGEANQVRGSTAYTIVQLRGLPPSLKRLITGDPQGFYTIYHSNSGALGLADYTYRQDGKNSSSLRGNTALGEHIKFRFGWGKSEDETSSLFSKEGVNLQGKYDR